MAYNVLDLILLSSPEKDPQTIQAIACRENEQQEQSEQEERENQELRQAQFYEVQVYVSVNVIVVYVGNFHIISRE